MTNKIKILLLVACLAASGASQAATYGERESLARLLHELQGLTVIIDDAQGKSNPDARITMNYQELRKDLARIRLGIQEYMDGPTIEPRKYEPLSGDYRQ